MYRITIIVGRLYKSAQLTNYFFKVPLVGRFVPLVGKIGRPMESPLKNCTYYILLEDPFPIKSCQPFDLHITLLEIQQVFLLGHILMGAEKGM